MSGGEGRASRLHHRDDVNVDTTDCGRTARERPHSGIYVRSWAVPPCCSSTVLSGWDGLATNERASLLRSLVEDRTRVHATTEPHQGGACQADAGPVPPFGDLRPASCRGTVLPRGGPAPALARGAFTRRSEDRFYASWRDAYWRELCGVELSAHELSL